MDHAASGIFRIAEFFRNYRDETKHRGRGLALLFLRRVQNLRLNPLPRLSMAWNVSASESSSDLATVCQKLSSHSWKLS